LIDDTALIYFKKKPMRAINFLTNYSVKTGNHTENTWKNLSHYLLIKYIDGNIKKEKDGQFLKQGGNIPVAPSQPGYPEWWRKKIVESTGDKLKVTGKKSQ
jgi:hypothetical protein